MSIKTIEKSNLINWGINSKYIIIDNFLEQDDYLILFKYFPSIELFNNSKKITNKISTDGKPKNKLSFELNDSNPNYSKLSINFRNIIEKNFNEKFVKILIKKFNMETLFKNKSIGFHTKSKTDFSFVIQCSINPIINNDTCPIRRIHLDGNEQLLTGLLYFRYDNDNSIGGDLDLYEYKNDDIRNKYTKLGRNKFNNSMNDRRINAKSDSNELKKIKTKKFKTNSCIFWKNSIDAIHSVTDRINAKHTRQYISFALYKNH